MSGDESFTDRSKKVPFIRSPDAPERPSSPGAPNVLEAEVVGVRAELFTESKRIGVWYWGATLESKSGVRLSRSQARGLIQVPAVGNRVVSADYARVDRPVVIGGRHLVEQPASAAYRKDRDSLRKRPTVAFNLPPVDFGRLPPDDYRVEVSILLRIDGADDTFSTHLYGNFGMLPVAACGNFNVMEASPPEIPNFAVPALSPFTSDGNDEFHVRGTVYLPTQDNTVLLRPLVMFTEAAGLDTDIDNYSELLTCISSAGFIVWAADAIPIEPGNASALDRALTLLANLFFAVDYLAAEEQLFFDEIPLTQGRLGFFGHSRGGEAAVLAAEITNELQSLGKMPTGFGTVAPNSTSPVGAVVAIAPANNKAPSAIGSHLGGYLAMVGNLDDDVEVLGTTDEYDRIEIPFLAKPCYRGLAVIDGMRHKHALNLGANLNDPFKDFLDEDLDANEASHAAIHAYLQFYAISFLRWRLDNNESYRPWFFQAETPALDVPSEDVEKISIVRNFRTTAEFYTNIGTLVPSDFMPFPGSSIWLGGTPNAPIDNSLWSAHDGVNFQFDRLRLAWNAININPPQFPVVRLPIPHTGFWEPGQPLFGTWPHKQAIRIGATQVGIVVAEGVSVPPQPLIPIQVFVIATEEDGTGVAPFGPFTASIRAPSPLMTPGKTRSVLETLEFDLATLGLPPGGFWYVQGIEIRFFSLIGHVVVSMPVFSVQ